MNYSLALLGLPAMYGAWFVFVVRKAANKTALWGPRWLAASLSSVLYNFIRVWMKYSNDYETAIKLGKFDPAKQYVMIWHPHGTFTIAALYVFSYCAASSCVFPGDKLYCAVADLLLSIPGLAEFLLLCNARAVNSRTCSNVLAAGKTLAIQPGGMLEQVSTDMNQERVFFPARLGFIRLAIKQGAPLLPVYAFGENQLYDTSQWMRSVNMWCYKKMGTGSLFVHGLFGVPISPMLPNPFCCPNPGRGLHVRFGEPVEVGAPDSDPSDEKVKEVFDHYSAALLKLFDTYKDECLPAAVAARGLEIVLRVDDRKKKA